MAKARSGLVRDFSFGVLRLICLGQRRMGGSLSLRRALQAAAHKGQEPGRNEMGRLAKSPLAFSSSLPKMTDKSPYAGSSYARCRKKTRSPCNWCAKRCCKAAPRVPPAKKCCSRSASTRPGWTSAPPACRRWPMPGCGACWRGARTTSSSAWTRASSSPAAWSFSVAPRWPGRTWRRAWSPGWRSCR
ncbi:hypothetical protein EMIT048CA2_10654 [Pseudomonas chlororaphis]